MGDQTVPDYRKLMDLAGRAFVVIGAGQGIGEQAAHALSQAGAKVLCVDSDPGRAAAVAGAVGGASCVADVRVRADVARVFAEAEAAFGKVDGVVDIVGVAYIKAIADFTDEVLTQQYDIVYRHVFLTLQAGSAALAKAGGGTMVFVGSVSGTGTIQGQAAYGSMKAALHHLVRYAGAEFGSKGIRVNAVAPGLVRTPRLEQMLSRDNWAAIERHIPIGHAAQPSEIAAAILFLSCGLSSHVTGHVLAADGGLEVASALPRGIFGPE